MQLTYFQNLRYSTKTLKVVSTVLYTTQRLFVCRNISTFTERVYIKEKVFHFQKKKYCDNMPYVSYTSVTFIQIIAI